MAVVRTEHVGRILAGRNPGQQIGTLTVCIEDSAPGVAPGLGNLISFEFRGNNVNQTHWLQFVWTELEADTTAGRIRASGVTNVDGVDRPLTTNPSSPIWNVDTLRPRGVPDGWRPLFPWYEGGASQGGPSVSNQGHSVVGPGYRKIYDRPGGPNISSIAQDCLGSANWTSARFSLHFVTYLMLLEGQRYRAKYGVQWYAFLDVRRVNNAASASLVDYRTEKAGPRGRPQYDGIPAVLLNAVRQEYPAYGGIE